MKKITLITGILIVAFSINAQVISLNGTWNFKADYYNKGAMQNWYGIDFSDLGWDKMQVPGNWDIRNEYAEFVGKRLVSDKL